MKTIQKNLCASLSRSRKIPRSFVAICVSILSAFSAFSADCNVIFFITDDESPTLGCYGDTAAKTPSIDEIAADAPTRTEDLFLRHL